MQQEGQNSMNVRSSGGNGIDTLATSDERRNRQKKRQYVDLPKKQQNSINHAGNNEDEADNTTRQAAQKDNVADIEMNED